MMSGEANDLFLLCKDFEGLILSDIKSWSVYVHINKLNGKKYFGITSKDPERRWLKGKGYRDNPHFRAAIEKYGWDGFDHIVLFSNLPCEFAKKVECEAIAFWNTIDMNNGYNMTLGGDGTLGCYPSDETRKKLSESRRRENLSDETRRRKSKAMKARKLSDEHKRKIGEGNSKSIKMYDLLGNFIKTFPSARAAEVELNISHSHISQCCHGKRISTGGYKWQFA